LAVMDDEGFVRITGRIKDIIIRGGENISPTEVEQILVTHPAIAQACVVPVPDPVLGERALSYLVLRPGAMCRGMLIGDSVAAYSSIDPIMGEVDC